jgi:hypothetical protein
MIASGCRDRLRWAIRFPESCQLLERSGRSNVFMIRVEEQQSPPTPQRFVAPLAMRQFNGRLL